ncbi:MAG: hypothetical protein MJZ46_01430 [Bacteroidales bacterium]|nr:hypothetical protein [Bacteroidales bacterium]
MRLVYSKILSIIVLAFVLTACNSSVSSSKVEQRIIFPSYSVYYDAEAQTLTATVAFQTDNESGDYIKLSKNSSISFNQQSMKQLSDGEKECFYMCTQKDVEAFPDRLNFEYQNDDGDVFTNELKLKSIQISDFRLNKNEVNVIQYKGKDIDEDETITLILKNGDKQYEILPDVGDNHQMLIDNSMLRDVKSGSYEGYLLRTSYSTGVNAMDRDGSAETTYHSKIYTITIQ